MRPSNLQTGRVVAMGAAAVPGGDLPALPELCGELFWPLARTDQRRWAEVYLRGLISVPGRKSIRRIAEHVVGYPAEQSLQQFLSQSPWDEKPVRRNLATAVSAALRPRAWAFREVAFPKHGRNSVAVARQYVPSAGRVLNGQVGTAMFLASAAGSCPVSWRLRMPRCWDDDALRRAGAGVPEGERQQPWWWYVLDTVDEMRDSWGLPPAPLLVDARPERELEPLLSGLEARGLRYLVTAGDCWVRPAGGGPAPRTRYERRVNVAEAAAAVPSGRRSLIGLPDGRPGRVGCSTFALTPLAGGSEKAPGRPVAAAGYRPPRSLLVEWPLGCHRPAGTWVTNLGRAGLTSLVGLARLSDPVDDALARLSEQCGLQHFEGRSFRGWHHHVTLVSAAHGYRLLRELGAGRSADHGLAACGGSSRPAARRHR
jgi:hypothetical protein